MHLQFKSPLPLPPHPNGSSILSLFCYYFFFLSPRRVLILLFNWSTKIAKRIWIMFGNMHLFGMEWITIVWCFQTWFRLRRATGWKYWQALKICVYFLNKNNFSEISLTHETINIGVKKRSLWKNKKKELKINSYFCNARCERYNISRKTYRLCVCKVGTTLTAMNWDRTEKNR